MQSEPSAEQVTPHISNRHGKTLRGLRTEHERVGEQGRERHTESSETAADVGELDLLARRAGGRTLAGSRRSIEVYWVVG